MVTVKKILETSLLLLFYPWLAAIPGAGFGALFGSPVALLVVIGESEKTFSEILVWPMMAGAVLGALVGFYMALDQAREEWRRKRD